VYAKTGTGRQAELAGLIAAIRGVRVNISDDSFRFWGAKRPFDWAAFHAASRASAITNIHPTMTRDLMAPGVKFGLFVGRERLIHRQP
jgi:hypothetical protein